MKQATEQQVLDAVEARREAEWIRRVARMGDILAWEDFLANGELVFTIEWHEGGRARVILHV